MWIVMGTSGASLTPALAINRAKTQRWFRRPGFAPHLQTVTLSSPRSTGQGGGRNSRQPTFLGMYVERLFVTTVPVRPQADSLDSSAQSRLALAAIGTS